MTTTYDFNVIVNMLRRDDDTGPLTEREVARRLGLSQRRVRNCYADDNERAIEFVCVKGLNTPPVGVYGFDAVIQPVLDAITPADEKQIRKDLEHIGRCLADPSLVKKKKKRLDSNAKVV